MSDLTPPLSSTTEYYRPVDVLVVQPRRPRYWLHALLLVATVFTTLVVIGKVAVAALPATGMLAGT